VVFSDEDTRKGHDLNFEKTTLVSVYILIEILKKTCN
jgi:hypothetical protein